MKVNYIRKDCCKSRQLVHSGWVQAMSISPNTNNNSRVQKLASVDKSGFVYIHSIHGNHDLELKQCFNDGIDLAQITSVCWTTDEEIAFGGSNGLIRIRDIENIGVGMTTPVMSSGKPTPVLCLARTGSRGHLLVSGGFDGKIKLYDPRSRRGLSSQVATMSAGYHPVRSLAATCHNTHSTVVAADGGASGDVHVFDGRMPRGFNELDGAESARWRPGTHGPKGNHVGILQGLGRVTRSVAMSESGDLVVTGGDDRMVRFWELGKSCCGPTDWYGDGDAVEEGMGLNSNMAWMGEWGVKSIPECVDHRMKLGGSILSLSCDGSGHTVLCTDITGGVYASVSSLNRVRGGMSLTHGGGLAHSDASMYEKDDSGWFNPIKEEEEEEEEESVGTVNKEGGKEDIVHKGEEDAFFDDETILSNQSLTRGERTHMEEGSHNQHIVETRNCCRIANITGRGLACAITRHGYLGVTGSDGEDDHALRLFDLRLAYTTSQLKNDGFGARDMREAGFSVSQLISAGMSAREALKGGYAPLEVAKGGFGPQELRRAGCSLKDLCEAGFDDAKTLHAIGVSASELRSMGFAPMELLNAGYEIGDLVKAGIRGKVLRELGCTIGETLDGVWKSLGKEAYFNELLNIALEWEYITTKTMSIMRDNIADGSFTAIYYADMWEVRLNVKNRHVHHRKRPGEADVLVWKDDEYYHQRQKKREERTSSQKGSTTQASHQLETTDTDDDDEIEVEKEVGEEEEDVDDGIHKEN